MVRLIVDLTDIIRIQNKLISDLYSNLSQYVTVKEMDKLGYIDRIEELANLQRIAEKINDKEDKGETQ